MLQILSFLEWENFHETDFWLWIWKSLNIWILWIRWELIMLATLVPLQSCSDSRCLFLPFDIGLLSLTCCLYRLNRCFTLALITFHLPQLSMFSSHGWASGTALEQSLATIDLFLFVLHASLSSSFWLLRWHNEVKSCLWKEKILLKLIWSLVQHCQCGSCNTYSETIPAEFVVVRPGCRTLADQRGSTSFSRPLCKNKQDKIVDARHTEKLWGGGSW